jgi:hypothetical protein
MLAVGENAMKHVLGRALGGAILAGASVMLCTVSAPGADNPTGTTPSAAAAAPAVSASGAAISGAAPAVSGIRETISAATPTVSATGAAISAATPAMSASPSARQSTLDPSSAGRAVKNQPTEGVIALRNTKDAAIVRNPYSWSVMVYKSQHRLVVYYLGHFYKEYHAVFGRNLDPGTKLWSGDRRTPEGAYTIIAKRLNRRWRYFLKLDYPNNVDHARYKRLVSEGEVPRFHGRAIPEGDGIGIHGTDEPILNTGNVNWTTGCISVDNGAIDELEALLPVGTLVVIKH